ncbi:MAG: hypothetical protein ABSD12_24650 [Paraburkholderia sp.]
MRATTIPTTVESIPTLLSVNKRLDAMAVTPWLFSITLPSGAALLLLLGTLHMFAFGIGMYWERWLRLAAQSNGSGEPHS